jgi:hypothetical protein
VIMFGNSLSSALLATMPFLFIVLTLLCIFFYHATLLKSIQELRQLGVVASTSAILDSADLSEIPYALDLSIYYLGIFVCAECAFLLTAIREYLQDAMHLDEIALLHGEAGIERGSTANRGAS